MTAVNSTINALAQTQPAGAKKPSTLDQTAFLKLMTTQLKTQDPFDPVDNQQMVAQMAQFSSVAGISEMNTALKGIADDMRAARMGDAASWIGRAALIDSDAATALKDGGFAGQITLPKDASAVSLSLVDANGAAVHTADLGAAKAGALAWSWDGKLNGAAVPGPLRVVVTASNATANGFLDDVGTATWTTVSGVQSPAGGSSTQLVTALGLLAPSDAQRLS